MNKLMNSEVKMTSLDISEIVGKEHENVLADIRKEIKDLGDGIGRLIFQPIERTDFHNRKQSIYEFGKDGAMQLALKYDAKTRYKVIKRVEELENPQPQFNLPNNFKEALYMLAETLGDALQEVVENNKEKVVLANAITSSDEGLLIEAAAKYMRQNGVNIGRDRLFEWLREQKYLISRKGREWNMPTQRAIEQDLIKVHNSLYYDSEGELKTNRQVVVTGKGLLCFINKFLPDGQLKLELEVT